MSDYLQSLAELVGLPRSLDERIARSKREVGAERERREAEIESVGREHEAVVSRLEGVLERAGGEDLEPRARAGSGDGSSAASADPIAYARQLVGRLEEALASYVYTRDALAAEEAKLSEAERRRAEEERLRREREELQRGEQWDRARQGNVGLLATLAVAAVVGLAVGAVGATAVLIAPVLVSGFCFAQAKAAVSTLPALAVRRASGSLPPLPVAPPREAGLAAAAHAGAGLALCALGVVVTAAATGAPSALLIGALGLIAIGLLCIAAVWSILPH